MMTLNTPARTLGAHADFTSRHWFIDMNTGSGKTTTAILVICERLREVLDGEMPLGLSRGKREESTLWLGLLAPFRHVGVELVTSGMPKGLAVTPHVAPTLKSNLRQALDLLVQHQEWCSAMAIAPRSVPDRHDVAFLVGALAVLVIPWEPPDALRILGRAMVASSASNETVQDAIHDRYARMLERASSMAPQPLASVSERFPGFAVWKTVPFPRPERSWVKLWNVTMRFARRDAVAWESRKLRDFQLASHSVAPQNYLEQERLASQVEDIAAQANLVLRASSTSSQGTSLAGLWRDLLLENDAESILQLQLAVLRGLLLSHEQEPFGADERVAFLRMLFPRMPLADLRHISAFAGRPGPSERSLSAQWSRGARRLRARLNKLSIETDPRAFDLLVAWVNLRAD